MKQGFGFGLAAAVAVAALRLGSVGTGSPAGIGAAVPRDTATAITSHKPSTIAAPYEGGCTAYSRGGEDTRYPYDTSRGAAKAALDNFFALSSKEDNGSALRKLSHVHYAIALTPDPAHTNLGLMFDRVAVVLEQAAQDEDYTYDSSWLPWKTQTGSPLLADQQFADAVTEHLQACPGVLLFRRNVSGPRPAQSDIPPTPASEEAYRDGLVVLVVGEQPTGGINVAQWRNAITWLRANASTAESEETGGSLRPRMLRVLGPNFSGSLVSLARELDHLEAPSAGKTVDTLFPAATTPVRVLSGSVGSCASVRWFRKQLASGRMLGRVGFGSFSENDELRIYRFLGYLNDQGVGPGDAAIVSEDETAYAYNVPVAGWVGDAPCAYPYAPTNGPVRLFFPRDISHMRSAYEKQSIFALPTGAVRSDHPILQDKGAAEGAENEAVADSLPSYSGEMSAIAQEAILYGLVSNLRVHHTRYILLRCTNPLDMLFLTRFFHRAYPEGRVVTVGADLLFRREIDTTEFRGTLSLSTYPLIPRNQHWARLAEVDEPHAHAHAHRIFESNAEGVYVAARYLLDEKSSLDATVKPLGDDSVPVVPFKAGLPEFANPFWRWRPDQHSTAQPPTWLSVVGRDGYWPLAVLDERFQERVPLNGEPRQPPAPPGTLLKMDTSATHPDRLGTSFSLATPWKIGFGLIGLLWAYTMFGFWWGPKLTSSGLFALFRPTSAPSQGILQGVHCALLAAMILSICSVGFQHSSVRDMFAFAGWLAPLALVSVAALLVTLLLRGSGPSRVAAMVYLASTMLLAWTLYCSFKERLTPVNELPFFYRVVHLTSGVSPLLPVLFLLAGFYLWTWQAMAGNTLLCSGRPTLPNLKRIGAAAPAPGWMYWRANWCLSMVGIRRQERVASSRSCVDGRFFRLSEEMGRRVVHVASPLCIHPKILLPPVATGLLAILLFAPEVPLLSLESSNFALGMNLALLVAFCLTIAETARLYFTWFELRRLLVALNQLRLRRTLYHLQGLSGSSLWSVSGNVQRLQFQLFIQQLSAGKRLSNLLPTARESLAQVLESGAKFSEVCAETISTGPQWERQVIRAKYPVSGTLQKPHAKEETVTATVREDMHNAVADVLMHVLQPCWDKDPSSLNLLLCDASKGSDSEANAMGTGGDPIVSAAEEFVCLLYISFIQNVMARMRTITLSMVFLFVSSCLAISFYPFVPKTQVGMWLILDFAVIATAVIYVYAGMERDETLSMLTNTHPGDLGSEFYLKTAAFLAGPLLGVLATEFPAFSESILRWLQPGIDLVH